MERWFWPCKQSILLTLISQRCAQICGHTLTTPPSSPLQWGLQWDQRTGQNLATNYIRHTSYGQNDNTKGKYNCFRSQWTSLLNSQWLLLDLFAPTRRSWFAKSVLIAEAWLANVGTINSNFAWDTDKHLEKYEAMNDAKAVLFGIDQLWLGLVLGWPKRLLWFFQCNGSSSA